MHPRGSTPVAPPAQPVDATPIVTPRTVPGVSTRTKLVALGLLPGFGFLLGPWTGLLMLPLATGPFFAYAFQLARPIHADRRRDVLVARTIQGLLFAFIPGLFIVAVLTSLATGTLGVRDIPFEVFVLFVLYASTVMGIALAAYHILHSRATAGEQKLIGRLRRPLVGCGLWVGVFLLLDVFFRRPFMSVDYRAVSSVGLYLGGAMLAAWIVVAVFRTFHPAPQDSLNARKAGPPVSPVFTPFRGS